MVKKLLISGALMLCLAGCSSEKLTGGSHESRDGVLTVDMTVEPQKAVYDSIVTIPLRLPDKEVIGSCGKVQYHDGHFYLWDRQQNAILAFDSKGNFTGKLDAIGHGPGEYVRIANFDITPDGLLYVFDPSGQKLLAYSTPDLTHRKSMSMKNRGLSFAVADSGHVYLEQLFGKGVNTKLALWTPADSVKSLIEYKIDGEARAAGADHFWRSGDKVLFYDAFSPDIYELTAEGMKPYLSFVSSNFPTGDQIIEMTDKSRNSAACRSERKESPMIRNISNVYVTPAWTSVNFYTTPAKFMVIDNSNGKLTEIENSERFNGNHKTAYGVADDFFITMRNGEDEENMSLVLYTLRPVGD